MMSSTALCCYVSYQLYYETFEDVSVSSSLNVGHRGRYFCVTEATFADLCSCRLLHVTSRQVSVTAGQLVNK